MKQALYNINVLPLCFDSSISAPHNGGPSINHVTACSTALQHHGWISSKNVQLEATGKSRNWAWNLSCLARSTTVVVEWDERLVDVERVESSVNDGVQDCSNSGWGESDGSDEKGKYRLRWNMLLSMEALREAHLLRVGSVTDAHGLRRKGHLKEQHGLTEFIISMHKTYSPVQAHAIGEQISLITFDTDELFMQMLLATTGSHKRAVWEKVEAIWELEPPGGYVQALNFSGYPRNTLKFEDRLAESGSTHEDDALFGDLFSEAGRQAVISDGLDKTHPAFDSLFDCSDMHMQVAMEVLNFLRECIFLQSGNFLFFEAARYHINDGHINALVLMLQSQVCADDKVERTGRSEVSYQKHFHKVCFELLHEFIVGHALSRMLEEHLVNQILKVEDGRHVYTHDTLVLLAHNLIVRTSTRYSLGNDPLRLKICQGYVNFIVDKANTLYSRCLSIHESIMNKGTKEEQGIDNLLEQLIDVSGAFNLEGVLSYNTESGGGKLLGAEFFISFSRILRNNVHLGHRGELSQLARVVIGVYGKDLSKNSTIPREESPWVERKSKDTAFLTLSEQLVFHILEDGRPHWLLKLLASFLRMYVGALQKVVLVVIDQKGSEIDALFSVNLLFQAGLDKSKQEE
eukprot:Gb_22693 [translate_table: standard]